MSRAYMMASEMHGCCYAGASAFDGGHLLVSDSCVQWSQFNGCSVYCHYKHTHYKI